MVVGGTRRWSISAHGSTTSTSFLRRIPVWAQSFGTAVAICALAAVPVFAKAPKDSRQGHDYLSSDKPESIRATQEQLRKEYRHQRNTTKQQQEQEQQEDSLTKG